MSKPGTTRAPLDRLEGVVAPLGSAIVAFSGGVDSSVVAAAAHRALGTSAIAVTAVSPALASGELDDARAVARAIGIRHDTVSTAELDREAYRRNGPDRCFHCKSELYEILGRYAAEHGARALLSGANADDAADWRPGLAAAAEHGVRHPLMEAGVGKDGIREIARALGLANADKPASPCLASRIPYGTAVDAGALAMIDRAELALKALGYRVLRVRHLGRAARVELGADELPRALSERGRAAVVQAVARAGYQSVRVSSTPFRSGSLNAVFLGSLEPFGGPGAHARG